MLLILYLLYFISDSFWRLENKLWLFLKNGNSLIHIVTHLKLNFEFYIFGTPTVLSYRDVSAHTPAFSGSVKNMQIVWKSAKRN